MSGLTIAANIVTANVLAELFGADDFTLVRLLSLALIVATGIILGVLWKHQPVFRWPIFQIGLFLAHSLTFYAVWFIDQLSGPAILFSSYGDWGTALRAHGYISLCLLAASVLMETYRGKHG